MPGRGGAYSVRVVHRGGGHIVFGSCIGGAGGGGGGHIVFGSCICVYVDLSVCP